MLAAHVPQVIVTCVTNPGSGQELIFGPVGVPGRQAVSVEQWLFHMNKKLLLHLVCNSSYILTVL